MESRVLGRTGREVSVVGLGCWQLGADWGEVGEDVAMAILDAAVDAGVTFLDTADVYGDGRSERLVGRLLAQRGPDAGLSWRRRWAAGPRRTSRAPTRWTGSARGRTARARTSASTASTSSSCTARRPQVFHRGVGLRRPRHAGGGRRDRRVRRERGDRGRGAHRDRPAQRGERADHPQRVPAQAAGGGAARGGRGRRGHHRARAAGRPGC